MKSIGFKITVIMLCVVLLGIAITVSVSTVISGNTIITESMEKVRSETGRQAYIMDEWLNYHVATVDAAASTLSHVNSYTKEYLRGIFGALLADNAVYQDVYMGFPDNTAIMGSGFPIEDEYSWWRATERSWYQVAMADISKAGITSLYVDTATKDLCITVARAVTRDNTVLGVAAIDILVNALQDMVFASNLDTHGFSMLLDINGDILIHPDSRYAPNAEGEFNNLATVDNGGFAGLWALIAGSDGIYEYKNPDGSNHYYTAATLESTGWRMVTVLPTRYITQPIYNVVYLVIGITAAIMLIAAFAVYAIAKNLISKPLIPVTAFFRKASMSGDITITQEDTAIIARYAGQEDEIGQLISSAAAFVNRLTEVSDALAQVAGGDLTGDLAPLSDQDRLGHSMHVMTNSLNTMFSEIYSSSAQVSTGSKQVADGAQGLAQGATEQAASIEELSSSIVEIAEQTRANAAMANQAASLATSIKENAEQGNSRMDEMVQAVTEINEASESISKVIKVIDDIAFQTNILSLNAAVEAARAGAAGKGFAVVAEEVRNLAAKSAEAAKDTEALIENSITKAHFGAQVAGETAASLAEIVSGINESTQLVTDIALSSDEQLSGITQVNIGIDQVAQVVQQNSATAEESAAASEQMSSQSAILLELISQFKLKDGGSLFGGPSAAPRGYAGSSFAADSYAGSSFADSYGDTDNDLPLSADAIYPAVSYEDEYNDKY